MTTLDSTFIRSCEDGERHLEVRVGNVETKAFGRQVFGAVAKTETDLKALLNVTTAASKAWSARRGGSFLMPST